MKPEKGLPPASPVAQSAADLAASTPGGPPPPGQIGVLRNLDELQQWLADTKTYCADPHADHARAADWLLDNDYQIARAIREVRQDMPAEFYKRLNIIGQGPEPKLPRIFAVAHGILDTARFQLTAQLLVEFLEAYQRAAVLTTAELWAMPSMLRLAALEILADGFAELNAELAPPFKTTALARASRPENPTDRIARAITIMIAVRAIEWRDVIDQTSPIEALLNSDPAGVYAHMDFATRDRYRGAVEDIAKGSDASEKAVAETALALARAADSGERRRHVGYWLADAGRPELENRVGFRMPRGEWLRRIALKNAGKVYAAGLIAFVLAALALPVGYMIAYNTGFLMLVAGTILSLLPATVLSIAILHWLINRLTRPWLLPMMDFRKGIPQDCPTCVAVPVIIGSAADIPRIIEKMEIRRLSNPDPMLRFVLLTDHADAPSETMPEDRAIRDSLAQAVRGLNERCGDGHDGPFFLLHRPRQFNPAEGCWMGRERKRGKLEQFNAFLLGGPADPFDLKEGDIERLRGSRFVITLDADTSLPPDTAARLVGALAHPLNRPVIDPEKRNVMTGYGILQPRVEVLPLKGPVSLFYRLYAGDTAIDIYSRAVSDVYQDLFGTGIFVGKGIYDVAAFQACLAGRVPENAILSHDLFEGLHCRAALVSNIVLYEDFPTTYVEYSMRLHRWVRGDWQLLPWLAGEAPGGAGVPVRNVFSGLDRWKIADNLRRSLLAPALLLFFIGGWMELPGSAWLWTLLAAAAPGAYLVGEAFAILTGQMRSGYFGDLARRFGERTGRWFLTITFLVSDTVVSLDAIVRTIWRMLWSRRHFLEWRSAAYVSADLTGGSRRVDTWSMMWPSTVFAALLTIDIALYNSEALLPAAPILAVWMVAPEIAVWLGRPRQPRRETLNNEERAFLERVARRTWLYFETFAGPEDNWLPPDNYQETPKGIVAHRTSPTNIGLFLTSAQAAHDFGFIDSSDFSVRIRNAFSSIERLENYRGHILNWYDTRTLAPLEPRYVSTVDSGNLAVCLIVLRQGCWEAADGPAIRPEVWGGLACNLDLLFEAVRDLPGANADAIDRCDAEFRKALHAVSQEDGKWCSVLHDVNNRLWPELEAAVGQAISGSPDIAERKFVEVHVWNERVHHHIRTLSREMETFLPWLEVAAAAPERMKPVASDVFDTLPATLPMALLDEHRGRADAVLERACTVEGKTDDERVWLENLRDAVEKGLAAQAALRSDLLSLASGAEKLAYGMDFRMLYDPEVRLFRIGYNVSTGQHDRNHYDLLATEARLASYFAIAKHDVPVEHWFSLGRPVTRLNGKPSVLSWNGSMFEYLMPPIFLPGQRDTLLGESESTSVDYQRAYARQRGVPWGISESAFATTDPEGNYQYRAFGAPGLGLRRGLTDDLVVAPYASALALCCWPIAAVRNMHELRSIGALGIYGFHDAVDYTPGRVLEGRKFSVVRNYMAHHHGMTMAAIANVLDEDIFVRRALAGKRMQAIEPLLQERVPWDVPIEKGRIDEEQQAAEKEHAVATLSPWVPSRATTVPQIHMLGNGRMASWVSESGAGYLQRQHVSLTRWLPDATRDAFGYWIYVQDMDSGETWSVGRLPSGKASPEARVVFHQHMVEMFRRDHGIAVRMEASVSPADDADIREINVTNESDVERTISFTSYAEVVLAPLLEDERHPAFSKLFVGSRYINGQQGLLFTRRPRRPEMKPPVLLHKLVSGDPSITVTAYESDRARFIGRLGDQRNPAALANGLTNTTGWTLDPVMSLQTQVKLQPGETKRFSFATIAGESRGDVLETAERYVSPGFEWLRRDAMRGAAREVARLEIDPSRLPELQVLASLLQMPHPDLRDMPAGVAANRTGQPDLWQFGISGDFPILLLRIEGEVPSKLLDLLIKAQRLWRENGMRMDLVLLRNEAAGYEAPLRERILAILRELGAYANLGTPGGIHVLSASTMAREMAQRLGAAAHVVLQDDGRPLASILDRIMERRAPAPHFAPSGAPERLPQEDIPRPDGLLFDNGIGGFDPESGDYVIYLEPDGRTPAPWCNVLANDGFGTIVSEAGLGFTWAVNSGENRLTPWSNDPVTDTPGEVLYLRDEHAGEVWTPTPAPRGTETASGIRHGKGWTEWRSRSHGLDHTLRAFVPTGDPVKIVTIRLTNNGAEPRRITATYFAEWLLGALASRAKPHTACEYDAAASAILANNAWNPEFADRVAFLTSTSPAHSITGCMRDFLGSEGSAAAPAALRNWDLGGRFEPDGDACAAYQIHLDIGAGETIEASFVLGQGADHAETLELVKKWRDPSRIESALEEVEEEWGKRLGAVRVKTPDPAFDLLVNRWLLYQATASRLMARAGFYQAGGAFGYRDQLQDVLALLIGEPERVRSQILLAAAHQFEEGDSQHWWHPPSGRGVRTRCSDDFIWLAYVTARYVEATGDHSMLDAQIPFLSAPPLRDDEDDRYALFETGARASLLEHCERALGRMMVTGRHGLPLIGTGDWNDGMDRVGDEGRGESVWLAWFQIETIERFKPLLERHGRAAYAAQLQTYADNLKKAAHDNAWDGAWFIRAFDDHGEPWGSHRNDECQIDAIAQSWSVISGGATEERMRTAMASARERLVHPDKRLVQLLDPPFHATRRDPGYIKAYPAGIRENGGQYTHAAAWMGHAFAGLGDGDSAWQVFDIVSPIRRTQTRDDALHYAREPYVLPGDVYGPGQNIGLGGWSWYTGAAGWTWQLGVEAILGIRLVDGALAIDPCLPGNWSRAEAFITGPQGTIDVVIEKPEGSRGGNARLTVDGKMHNKTRNVDFPGRGKKRVVRVELGDREEEKPVEAMARRRGNKAT